MITKTETRVQTRARENQRFVRELIAERGWTISTEFYAQMFIGYTLHVALFGR